MSSAAVPVAISTYSNQAHIGATLDSILAQSFHGSEVVAVADASTDGGPAIVQGFANARVRLPRHPSGGVSADSDKNGNGIHG